MSKERDGLVNWTRTPPIEIALIRPKGMDDEDVATWRRIRPCLNNALTNAEKYLDLNGIFTELLGYYEVIILY